MWPRNQTFWGEAHHMRSAVGNGLCRFVIGISCRTMLGCGPQMCSDVADLIRRSSVVHSAARSCAKAADRYGLAA